jgi:hypothetical protein
MAYARIVEGVSHIILKSKKAMEMCSCGKVHREWFCVDVNSAAEVVGAVRMWTERSLVLEQGPEGTWYLTHGSRNALMQIATSLLRNL